MDPHAFTIDHLLALRRPTGMVPLHLSPDGRLLTFTVRPVYAAGAGTCQPLNEEIVGSSVLVLDTVTGETREVFAAGTTSWGGQWSPDGRWLAAYAQNEGPACLGIWEVGTSQARLLGQVRVKPYFGMEVPQWTPDGSGLVVKLAPEGDVAGGQGSGQRRGEAPAVTVFSFDPDAEGGAFALPGRAAELRADLGYVGLEAGEVRTLAEDWAFSGWRVAPDGHAVAVLRMVGEAGLDLEQYELMVVPLDGSGPPRRVATGVLQFFGLGFAWSPSSRAIAYLSTDGRSGRMFLADSDGSAEPRDITAGGSVDLGGDYLAAPRWSADGRAVFGQGEDSVWAFSSTGGERRELRVGPDRKLRFWVQRPMAGLVWPPDGRSILAAVRDPATKNEGLVRIDLESGQAGSPTELAGVGIRKEDSEFRVEAAPDGTTCYLLLEAAHHPSEIWRVATDASAMQRVAALNPQVDGLVLGGSRLIEWKASGGQQLQGALLLPPGHEEGKRLPVIVDVYEGSRSHSLNYFGLGDYDQHNGHLLASRGYAVFKPDLPLADSDPMRQLPGLLLPAIDELTALGLADPDRIGLLGESYGGYLVLGLLTQTARFRAAVAISGAVNLTSAYGALTDQGDSDGAGVCERGQFRIGGPPWERPQTYIENSPLFSLDRVRTPLLLVAGAAHWDDPSQAKQAFSALRRLGGRVELRLYRGEGHSPCYWSRGNLRDLCRWMLEWFDLYLSAPTGGRGTGA